MTNNGTTGGILGGELAFVPILLAEFTLSIFSNTVLLLLIIRSYKDLTILNIFLSSLGIMNLVLSVNQILLITLIFENGRSLPSLICHLSYGIQAAASYGITLLHLAISYNRYQTVKKPFYWESRRKQALVTVGAIWGGVLLIATLESILNIGGIRGDIKTCYWPDKNNNMAFKFFSSLVIVVTLVCVIIVTYYYHGKTFRLLHNNRKSLEQELAFASEIELIEKGNKSTPEKTSCSLILIFTIHAVTLLIVQVFNLVRIIVSWTMRDMHVNFPSYFLTTLLCTNLFTTVSPLLFMVISQKFKENVKNIFKCKKYQRAGSVGMSCASLRSTPQRRRNILTDANPLAYSVSRKNKCQKLKEEEVGGEVTTEV